MRKPTIAAFLIPLLLALQLPGRAAGARNVTMEVRAIDVARSTLKEFGVEWSVAARRETGPSWGRPRKGFDVRAAVTASQRKQSSRSNSVLTLTTIDGRPSSLNVGSQVPFTVTRYDAFGATRFVQLVDFGIRLTARPEVQEDGKIKLDLRLEVSTVDPAPAQFVAGSSYPLFRTRTHETSLVVDSGETLIAGQFYSDAEWKDLAAVPGISRVPVLGELFKQRRNQREQQEFVLFVTARITG